MAPMTPFDTDGGVAAQGRWPVSPGGASHTRSRGVPGSAALRGDSTARSRLRWAMRIEPASPSVSWIPSDLIEGMGKMATRMKLAHHDPPPPDALGAESCRSHSLELRADDRFRFANHLRAVDRGRRRRQHHRLRLLRRRHDRRDDGRSRCRARSRIPAVKLPDRRTDAEATTPSRCGSRRPPAAAPACRCRAPSAAAVRAVPRADRVDHARADDLRRRPPRGQDRRRVRLSPALGLRRRRTARRQERRRRLQGLDERAFGKHTPWGDEDSPALVTEVETRSSASCRTRSCAAAPSPRSARVKEGTTLVEQGDATGDELFLLLDGVLVVEVDGEPLAELGPGAVLGERAVLEGGRRTATLRAVTDCKVAAVPVDQIDPQRLDRAGRRPSS